MGLLSLCHQAHGSYSITIGGGGAAAQSSGQRYNYGVDGGSGGDSYFSSIKGGGGSGGAKGGSHAVASAGTNTGTIAGDTSTAGPYNGYGQGGIGGTQNSNCEYSNSAQSGGTQGIVIITYIGSGRARGGTVTTSGNTTIHTFTSNGTFTVNY